MFIRTNDHHLNGSILISVIILLGLLFTLGSALLRLSLIDSQIAVNLENNLKAYYYAVSGVEMAQGVLQINPGYRGAFSHDMAKGSVKVSVEQYAEQSQDEWIKIVSTGKKSNARETVYLQFKTVPSTPANALCAASLGWIESDSGEMLIDAAAQDNHDVYIHSAFDDVYARENSEEYAYFARSIYFEGDPSMIIENCTVKLIAEAIVFRGRIILSGQNACLRLRSVDDNGVRVQFLEPVKDQQSTIIVKPGMYQIPGFYSFTIDTTMYDEINQYQIFPKVPDTKRWGQQLSQ